MSDKLFIDVLEFTNVVMSETRACFIVPLSLTITPSVAERLTDEAFVEPSTTFISVAVDVTDAPFRSIPSTYATPSM